MSWIANFLKPHRTIPTTPWTGNGRWDLSVKRVAILWFGLTIFGFGDALIVNSMTGNAPWSVLAQGFANRTGMNMGTATLDRKSTRLNSSHIPLSRMPSSA